MTHITLPRATVEQALEALKSCSGVPHWPALQPTIHALRAALEQQAEPVAWEGWWLHHGQHNYRAKPLSPERVKELMKLAFEVGREATLPHQAEPEPMSPEQRQRWEELAAMPQQAEPLNLSDPAVQKRLASQWGYVPAAQAEPVEPVAGVVLNEEGRAALVEHGREEWHCAARNARRLYTAPPQRKPLPKHDQHCVDVPGYGLMAVRLVRAVERAHGITGDNNG